MLDDLSDWAGKTRDRTLESNRRLVDPKQREKIGKGQTTPESAPYDVYDNDFHPDDKGLEASKEDHWGTVKKIK